MNLEGKDFFVTTSVGISIYPADGQKPDDLLQRADFAMYKAKQSGKNCYQFYRNELHDRTLELHRLEFDLRKAIQLNLLQVYFQPLVDLTSNQIIGTEALARWYHPELGSISPSVFIPIAENCGLIGEIGSWVMLTACKYTKQWREMYGAQLAISVNVSSYQFQRIDFIQTVQQILKETGLSPSFLHLEITESTALLDVSYTNLILKELRDIGISISMDDFGTGYSSLSYIKDFPIDTLKIDRSFITNISKNERDAAIVKTIITLSRNLNIKVLAEGVETIEQLERLREYECDEIQGYLVSQPLPEAEFVKQFLASNKDTVIFVSSLKR